MAVLSKPSVPNSRKPVEASSLGAKVYPTWTGVSIIVVVFLHCWMKDARPLSRVEKNFKKQVKSHLAKVLESKRTYWKQRACIRFAQFGDENTKFSHSMATHYKRRNLISQLTLSDGTRISQHSDKAEALWVSFKNRMGTSECHQMYYDLDALLQRVPLPEMDSHFLDEEIKAALDDMLPDHAPGPDGFNDMFMKKCWPLIQSDLHRFILKFNNGSANLKHVNGSFITLIAKKDNRATVNDYISISLLNSSLKLLTKLVVNRLQKVIQSIIYDNQYGFIKGRTIQDCLAWAFEFLHLCHQSKRQVVILNLDFKKAFDVVEHEVIL
jgi:hypothetical protein